MASSRRVRIFDAYKDAHSFYLDIEVGLTVGQLKQEIASRHVDQPAPSVQRLVCGGSMLNNDSDRVLSHMSVS